MSKLKRLDTSRVVGTQQVCSLQRGQASPGSRTPDRLTRPARSRAVPSARRTRAKVCTRAKEDARGRSIGTRAALLSQGRGSAPPHTRARRAGRFGTRAARAARGRGLHEGEGSREGERLSIGTRAARAASTRGPGPRQRTSTHTRERRAGERKEEARGATPLQAVEESRAARSEPRQLACTKREIGAEGEEAQLQPA